MEGSRNIEGEGCPQGTAAVRLGAALLGTHSSTVYRTQCPPAHVPPAHMWACARTGMYTRTQMWVHSNMRSPARARTRTPTSTRTHPHTHLHPHIHPSARTHTHTHARG